MGYYLDLSSITLEDYKKRLLTQILLPSQQVLKDNLEERIQKIKEQNISNLSQLQQVLKTKDKINQFARITSLPVDYLTIMRREINSYHPAPRAIKDYPCLAEKLKNDLIISGIKTTDELFDRIAAKKEREKLKEQFKISDSQTLLLAKITDVSRLRYVNPAFATLLVNSKYDTVEKIKNADFEELYNNLVQLNKDNVYFKGKINLKDIKFLIADTDNISTAIEY